MRRIVALIIVGLFVGLNPQLGVCKESASQYPLKDAGIYAEDADIVWLDNERVLFHGYKGVELVGTPEGYHAPYERGLYLWNTASGTLELYETFEKRHGRDEGRARLCVHDGVLTYVMHGLIITGERRRETKTPFPGEKYWFNPFTCRYYGTRPGWVEPYRSRLPLRDEHGFLDFGVPVSLQNWQVQYFRVGQPDSISLPIGTREAWPNNVSYIPFRKAYFIVSAGRVEEDGAVNMAFPLGSQHPVWWLLPNGEVTRIDIPVEKWMGSSNAILPVQPGLFVASRSARGRGNLAYAGGYLVVDKKTAKMVTGLLEKLAVSPDGCKVAFVVDPYDQRPPYLRVRMNVVDVCQGRQQ